MTPRRITHREQPARCSCMPGPAAAPQHGDPKSTAADHGNPFTHRPGCVHSELQHTTKPPKKRAVAPRLRLQ